MKTAILFVLALAALAAGAPKDHPNCSCGMFVQKDNEIHRVYRLESSNVASCDDIEPCKTLCATEFDKLTGGGDLNHVISSGMSVGQEVCLYMLSNEGFNNVMDAIVYGYASLCHGPWVYDGYSSTNKLCCYEGFYESC